MSPIGLVLLSVGGIGSLVCWIMVLIKMFQTEKPLIGVLGILCNLWAFIWGWMKSTSLGLKKVMILWTLCLVLAIIGNVINAAAIAQQIQSGELNVQPTP